MAQCQARVILDLKRDVRKKTGNRSKANEVFRGKPETKIFDNLTKEDH